MAIYNSMIKERLPEELVSYIFEFVNGNPKENHKKVLSSLTEVFRKNHEFLEYANKGYSSEEDYDYEMSIIPSIYDLWRWSRKHFVNNTSFYKKEFHTDHQYLLYEFEALRDQMELELNDYFDEFYYSGLLISWIKYGCLVSWIHRWDNER